MMYSALSHLECARCGDRHDAARVQGTCACGSPLLARYDTDLVAAAVSPAKIAARPPDLWRYHELLPVGSAGRVLSLGEGMTPLLALPRIGRALGVPRLLMKDEGLIPTGTFKARGAAVGGSRAAELGVTGVAMPTNGNAGAAWAVYAARAGMRSLIVMPTGPRPSPRPSARPPAAGLTLSTGRSGGRRSPWTTRRCWPTSGRWGAWKGASSAPRAPPASAPYASSASQAGCQETSGWSC